MEQKDFHAQLLAWVQRKSFVWGPSPELYGGLAGFYDYAPLGKLLKNRVEFVIRDTLSKHQFWEVECPIISPKAVWEASGHLGNFTDPIIACDKCKATFRADNLLEEVAAITTDNLTDKELKDAFAKENIICPSCKKGTFTGTITRHNLMMQTTVGMGTIAYNRPETATTTYLPFQRYLSFFRDKLPFGVFQIGKAFRNEISPRQHILRMREFTQAEAQLFIFEEEKKSYEPFSQIQNEEALFVGAKDKKEMKMTFAEALKKKYLGSEAYAWTLYLAHQLFIEMGIPKNHLRLRQHGDEEKAFYALDAWDIEIKLNSFGWTEVCGVHDRADYDLTQHAKAVKKPLVARTPNGEKKTPHVLEIAFGTDRPTFALMDLFFSYNDSKEQEVFTPPYKMAPISVAVFSLVNKEELPKIAHSIFETLKKEGFIATYDVSGSIGRRYARMDEVGTPFCVTVDFDTLKDDTVTIRDRDSIKQERIKISELVTFLRKQLSA